MARHEHILSSLKTSLTHGDNSCRSQTIRGVDSGVFGDVGHASIEYYLDQ